MEDVKIREYLKNKLKDSAVSRIEIETRGQPRERYDSYCQAGHGYR